MTDILTARLECLKLAAELMIDVQRPDAEAVVDLARIFEAYITDNAQNKTRPRQRQRVE